MTRLAPMVRLIAGLIVIALVVAAPPTISLGPALATMASAPTVTCSRHRCQQCVEYEHAESGDRCIKCGQIAGCTRRYSTGNLSADAQAILTAHNGYRAKHCVPDLNWSAELAASAQQWASGCKYGHSGTSGENIAWSRPTLSPTKPVDSWYSEITQYDFNNPIGSYKTGKVLHFTQVVWRGSSQLGCGVATCPAPAPDGANSGWGFMVCRYAPPGNFNGENPGVLDANVPPPCK
jgi:pathogenesis-related protein 1